MPIREKEHNISKQLTWLFWIFIAGFLLQALIHLGESYYNAQLDKKIENAQIEGIVGSEIIFHIKQIKQQYYQITSILKPETRQLLTKEVDKEIEKVHLLINVLENGGSFSQELKLNLPDNDNVINVLYYRPETESDYNILSISVKPKLQKIRIQFDKTNLLLDQANNLLEKNSRLITRQLAVIQKNIKNVDPLFVRLLENTNRIHYQQQNRLKALKASVAEQKSYFKAGQYFIIGLILLVGLLFFILISRQIHDMAEALQTEKNKALAATESKSIFLANMSHEIRTPLNAITGFINILKEQENNPDKLQYLKTIDKSSQSLLGIINDILDFSKVESNKLEFDFIDFDPQDSFSSVADLFKAKCSEKNILLVVDMDPDLPNSLHSDPLRIKQVLSNLLSNAVKFTDPGKTIKLEIKYSRPNQELFVAVIDEGIGIPKEKQNTIFEAFSQAETNTTRKYGGTGLGLAISSLLIELLGGRLALQSEEGQGSKFYFTLPIQEGDKIQASADNSVNTLSYHGKLLLVEDNKTNQMLMGAIFKKMGVDYDLAEDGLLAVEAYRNHSYNLILMDENMPNMSGSEAARQIRELEAVGGKPHTPIVALTANAMKGDRERFLNAGMDDYLSKPLKIPELNRILKKFLNS